MERPAQAIIDAHQHFWKFDPVRDSWIDDSMQVIQRDFLPNDIESSLQQHGIQGTVVVQSDQSEAENAFQLELAAQHDFIKGVVGWTDLQQPNVQEHLARYSAFKKMKGFRHVLQGEPQRDLMLQPVFMHGIGCLAQYNFTYDILIYPDQLIYAQQLVQAFPNQKFVVDHLAKPPIKSKALSDWKMQIEALAQHDNVWCKVSGMATEADWYHWKQEDFTPYLDVIAEAFGTKRIMFGSDWPVCLVAASYGQVLGIAQGYFNSFSQTEREDIFGNNAVDFYNL